MDFLFVCNTPPRCLLWLHHAVRSLVGRGLSELRATFPMKISCCVAICFSVLGISKNFFLTVSFVMCWYLASAILMPNRRWMLRCSNTSSVFWRYVRSAHISYPHSNRLMGMARNMRYLLRFLTLSYVHNLVRDHIYEFPDARCASISYSSRREYEM